jgi:hypothetical protein
MTYWLYMHINFGVLDAATAFIPVSFLSFFVLPWAILNVASTIFPFELSPGFYKWQYAVPGYNCFSILIQIWSGGCNNRLYRALPILFAWEVFGATAGVAGVFYRNSAAEKDLLKKEREQRELAKTRKTSDVSSTYLKPEPDAHAAGASWPQPLQGRLVQKARANSLE